MTVISAAADSIIVDFDTEPGRPISPAWLARADESRARLATLPRLVAIDGLRGTFELDDPPAPGVVPGVRAFFTSTFAPWQLEIIQDLGRVWRPARFAAGDARATGRDGAFEVVRGGWDHEHCVGCHATIDPASVAAFESEGDWLCERCHRGYVIDGRRERIGDRC